MVESDTPAGDDGTGANVEATETEAIRSTEAYEAENGVVFYDSEDPLAWLQSDHVVDLDDAT